MKKCRRATAVLPGTLCATHFIWKLGPALSIDEGIPVSHTDLVSTIKKSLALVIVEDDTRVLSAGSGVLINGKGRLLTAKHVIVPNGDFLPGRINVRFNGQLHEYVPKTPADFAIALPLKGLWNSINIDLAILEPVQEIRTDFLPCAHEFAKEGSEVLIAGYPDDCELVLDFMAFADRMNPDVNTLVQQYERKFKYHMRQHLFRKALVGNVQKLDLLRPNPFNADLAMAQYWLDKDLTYGGSGGPVVGTDGLLYGVMVHKGLTDAKRFMIQGQGGTVTKLPSGTGIAISPELAIRWLDELAPH